MRQIIPGASLLALLLLGCDGSPEAIPTDGGDPAAFHAVEVDTVAREVVPRLVTVVGTVHARERVTVTNEVPGTVARIHVDLGDVVEAGDELLDLDRRELELQVGAAGAGLAQAEAERARAYAAWQRAQRLYPREVISKERLDAVLAAFRVAEANHQAAEKRLALAEKKRDDATVRAPFRAAVQARLVAAGQYVPAYTPLFELVDSEHVKFRGEVPERFAQQLRHGGALKLRVDSLPDETFDGTVTRVGSALNTTTRSLPFESEIPNPTGKLTPGMFARAQLLLDPQPMLLMPRAALVEFAGVTRAFVVRDGHAESRPIDVGTLIDGRIEVVAGLSAGDVVVTAGHERLADGAPVHIGGTAHR